MRVSLILKCSSSHREKELRDGDWVLFIVRPHDLGPQSPNDTCQHILTDGLRISPWSSRGISDSVVSSQNMRERKYDDLPKLRDNSDVCVLAGNA